MPKSVNPSQKRAEFVAASWDVIAAEGLRAATLRRVAAEAGCTTGALTHYFADRRALLTDALRAAHSQAGARMLEAARRTPSDLERLKAVLLEALPLDEPRLREWRVWLAFWAASMNDAELSEENALRYAEWRGLLLEVVGPLTRNASQTEQEVAHLVALVDGLGLRLARHTEGDAALEAQQRECAATLMRYLSRFEAD